MQQACAGTAGGLTRRASKRTLAHPNAIVLAGRAPRHGTQDHPPPAETMRVGLPHRAATACERSVQLPKLQGLTHTGCAAPVQAFGSLDPALQAVFQPFSIHPRPSRPWHVGVPKASVGKALNGRWRTARRIPSRPCRPWPRQPTVLIATVARAQGLVATKERSWNKSGSSAWRRSHQSPAPLLGFVRVDQTQPQIGFYPAERLDALEPLRRRGSNGAFLLGSGSPLDL